jgi:hypothetical protein
MFALVVDSSAATEIAKEVVHQYKQNPKNPKLISTPPTTAGYNHLPTSQAVESKRDVSISLPSVQTSLLYFNTVGPGRPLLDMALPLQTAHYLVLYCIRKDLKDVERCKRWMHPKLKMGKFSWGAYLGGSDFHVGKSI